MIGATPHLRNRNDRDWEPGGRCIQVGMRSLLLALGLAAACGGSDHAAPPARPAERVLRSEPITSTAQRPVASEERQAATSPPPATATPATPTPAPAPAPEPDPPVDGVYSPRYVQVNSTKLLDQRITVKGVVVWIYDCVADVAAREPDRSRDEVRKLVAKKPELCKRPHFYLGERKTTPVERAVMVVEVPRPMRADERISLSKDQIAAWPVVPSIAVGQTVAVEGTWALHSPKGYANPDGLLVYRRMAP